MGRRVMVVTPWFPTPGSPMRGSFVSTSVASLRSLGADVDVMHLEDWPSPRDALVTSGIRRAARRLEQASPAAPMNLDPPRVTFPLPVRKTRDHARHATDALRAFGPHARSLLRRAEVIHAHVVLPTGLIAARHRSPSTRLVVTEHASYLAAVFAQPRARRLYEEVIDSVDELLCVSGPLRNQVLQQFPGYAAKVSIVPNGVDFSGIPIRPSPPTALRRWIYVGSLTERKDPLRLLEAFALCRLRDPRLELTFLGEGPLWAQLRTRIDELGMGDSVRMEPPVPHSAVPTWIATHDLLVHASRYETFGLTPVEALATKTPVLVSRHGAAESLLGDIEESAGALFPVDATPTEMAHAYQMLCDRLAELDIDRAYAILRKRLGNDSVGRQLARHLHLDLDDG